MFVCGFGFNFLVRVLTLCFQLVTSFNCQLRSKEPQPEESENVKKNNSRDTPQRKPTMPHDKKL